MVIVPGVALRLSCVTYCHIRIKLAATSTDEPAFLATLIELSVWSRHFRLSITHLARKGRMTDIIGRRELLAALGGAAAWPLAARAQQPAMRVIGFLSTASPEAWIDYVAGSNKVLVKLASSKAKTSRLN